MSYGGAIFDVDGVLVDSPHERAWRETLRLLMEIDWRDVQPRTTHTPECRLPKERLLITCAFQIGSGL